MTPYAAIGSLAIATSNEMEETAVIYDPLAGSWTYRSLINQPDVLPDLDPEHIVKDDVDK